MNATELILSIITNAIHTSTENVQFDKTFVYNVTRHSGWMTAKQFEHLHDITTTDQTMKYHNNGESGYVYFDNLHLSFNKPNKFGARSYHLNIKNSERSYTSDDYLLSYY